MEHTAMLFWMVTLFGLGFLSVVLLLSWTDRRVRVRGSGPSGRVNSFDSSDISFYTYSGGASYDSSDSGCSSDGGGGCDGGD